MINCVILAMWLAKWLAKWFAKGLAKWLANWLEKWLACRNTFQYYRILQSLHKHVPVLPYTTELAQSRSSTTVYYKACTNTFQYYRILQSCRNMFQYYRILQSLHTVVLKRVCASFVVYGSTGTCFCSFVVYGSTGTTLRKLCSIW